MSLGTALPKSKLQRMSILNHSKCGALKKPYQGTGPLLSCAGPKGKLSLLMDQLSAPRILPLSMGPEGILSRGVLFSCSVHFCIPWHGESWLGHGTLPDLSSF